MNKFLKILLMGSVVLCAVPAVSYADDDADEEEYYEDEEERIVVDRLTCDNLQEYIAELSAIADPTDEDLEDLEYYRAEQRRMCSKRSVGRSGAATARTGTKNASSGARTAPRASAKKSITDQQLELCDMLPDVIASVESDQAKLLQENYDKYCKDSSATMDASIVKLLLSMIGGADEVVPVAEQVAETAPVPVISEQQAAENLAAGLCADGAKPNKFGCCGDKMFKDKGNLVFECCNKDGTDCVAPISKGN